MTRLFQFPSARLCLALGALLLLAGCGGGGGGASTTTSQDASLPATEASKSPTEGRGSSPRTESEAGSGPADERLAQASPDAGAAKQGERHIVPPKGPQEAAPTQAQQSNATVADMALESPAVQARAGSLGVLPAANTCDGKDTWPALAWRGVPPDTTELAVFAMSFKPVEGKLFVDWAVAGLDPSLEGIEAGRLPKGAVVGRNSFGKVGYSICPPEGAETYAFAVYALSKSLSPQQGFDARELRKEVLDVSGNVGLLPVLYAR